MENRAGKLSYLPNVSRCGYVASPGPSIRKKYILTMVLCSYLMFHAFSYHILWWFLETNLRANLETPPPNSELWLSLTRHRKLVEQ